MIDLPHWQAGRMSAATQHRVRQQAAALCLGHTTPAQLNGLDSAQLAAAYERGHAAWLQGDLDSACMEFAWLVMQQPFNPQYHLALSATLQANAQAMLALSFCHYAHALQPDDPHAIWQIATCLAQLHDLDAARAALQDVLCLCEGRRGNEGYPELAQQARAKLQTLHY
ncbi:MULTISPECIES: hypothetical protein [unclassified Paludibacterium]|uniref:hypothetical protein n=1 Tax=unclassified Paludibacterium TaxID=2618429 RepID=UPI001C04DD28|nr:hypothetical protein [Paludibacterium sp. B53371]BEV73220.1 SycD/LcrH family type III secretion system chaperone SscB [Paludibacterium sp. THUN1379]